jgi:predicted MFS family arabinose efflux permease
VSDIQQAVVGAGRLDRVGQTPRPVPASQPVERSSIGLREYVLLVGVGAFVTTFAQSRVLGLLPTTFLLKEQFHLPKESVAFFFFWVTFPWNVKPLVGILTDAFPLFGTRRRHYMLLGSTGAVLLWLLMGASSRNYLWLLYATLGMNIATVLASTVMGGLMVEAGQAYGAPGRMSSLRQVVMNAAAIVAPLLGGYLAARAYGWTAAIGAAASLGLAVCTFVVLREPRVDPARYGEMPASAHIAQRPPLRMTLGLIGLTALATSLLAVADLRNVAYSLYGLVVAFVIIMVTAVIPTPNPVIVRAQHQLSQIFRSSALWIAAFLVFLVYTVPGYNTALVYQQSDVLKFGKPFIGLLKSLEGVFGVGAALCYAFLCRRLNLRALMLGGVGLNGLMTFLYLIYAASTAPFVHSLSGFAAILSELALMDLAIRATPRGCEALGFALMMSVRNFGTSISDVLGTQLMDQYHIPFGTLIAVNALLTLAVLVFVPLLPRAVLSRREGEAFT